MQKHVNILAKQELIRSDKALVKEYVQEFIKEIQLFRIASFCTLVVIHFIDGGEYSFDDFDRMVRQKGLWTYYTTFSFCDIDDNKSRIARTYA